MVNNLIFGRESLANGSGLIKDNGAGRIQISQISSPKLSFEYNWIQIVAIGIMSFIK
jgi:hypothetical protein